MVAGLGIFLLKWREDVAPGTAHRQPGVAEVHELDQLPRRIGVLAPAGDAGHRAAPGAGAGVAFFEDGQGHHPELAGHRRGVALQVVGPPVGRDEGAGVAGDDVAGPDAGAAGGFGADPSSSRDELGVEGDGLRHLGIGDVDAVVVVDHVDVALEQHHDHVVGGREGELHRMTVHVAAPAPIRLEGETLLVKFAPRARGGQIDPGLGEQVLAVGKGDGVDVVGHAEDDAALAPRSEPAADDAVDPGVGAGAHRVADPARAVVRVNKSVGDEARVPSPGTGFGQAVDLAEARVFEPIVERQETDFIHAGAEVSPDAGDLDLHRVGRGLTGVPGHDQRRQPHVQREIGDVVDVEGLADGALEVVLQRAVGRSVGVGEDPELELRRPRRRAQKDRRAADGR